jgi:ectoine hydroxylase-related dioxygenase (phytanoyl-CoA dioxygenase family)
MRTIFRNEQQERFFRDNGFVVFDLLNERAIRDICAFYEQEFKTGREVYPFAQNLPYYISIFDQDSGHKQRVDSLITAYVSEVVNDLMFDYEIFYSNLMIKFPNDGQIEAHQDFNFVDESQHTAFNLWCPLVDTERQNGGLFVIPGSHNVFRTQRGPNIPKALTQYNEMLQRYAILIPLRKGQGIIFDHKLVHYSPPNRTSIVRLAIQSVLKPAELPALHYFFAEPGGKVEAYRINKEYILANNLWESDVTGLIKDHAEDLIPFPEEKDVVDSLVKLKLHSLNHPSQPSVARPIFKSPDVQESFELKGYVKLPVLEAFEVDQLREVFAEMIGEDVQNTDYGMYISLEEPDAELKTSIVERVSGLVLPQVSEHFINCKSHLGSFLVKSPSPTSYTYPHQDWTFVDWPDFCSITVWIALVDTSEDNGALGFVNGSHKFFDQVIGSPSPDFRTFTQGHEDLLYEYLEFVPLKAGEAIAFNNRTIHGAPPNVTDGNRLAVAIGMTPAEAQLYHYYLVPNGDPQQPRRIAKLKVDQQFFHRYSVSSLKEMFDRGESPANYETVKIIEEPFNPFTRREIQELCEQAKLKKNGKKLVAAQQSKDQKRFTKVNAINVARELAHRFRVSVARMKI